MSQPKRLVVAEAGQKHRVAVRENALVAVIGQDIRFDLEVLEIFDVKGSRPLHYDLLVLCAAIEFADRRWKRPQGWRRAIDVVVPVIDMKVWRKPSVLQPLRAVLNHLTGDAWRLSFVEAKNSSPIGSRQNPLDLGHTKTFAIAYSDGLDSRAVSALSGADKEALCVRVAGSAQRRKVGDSRFFHVPFKVEGHQSNESSFRSRGFQFAIVSAIAAHLAGVRRIVVPESGQGALGPVLLPLHNVYADYRNHPAFLRRMERFICAALGYQVRFEQPRLWSTKGQTLSAFLQLQGKTHRDLTSTHSCWQKRRVVNLNGRKHCGLCAACLLRRLSLHSAGVSEPSDAYVVSDLTRAQLDHAMSAIARKADRNIMIEYGSVGVRHIQQLADLSNAPDEDLHVHASQISAAIANSQEETLRNLRGMLAKHADEWRAFLLAQGKESFLKSWLDGGRSGGPK